MLKLVLVLALAQSQAKTPFLYDDRAADETIRQAMHATYNLELSQARQAARNLQRTHPDHPAGYLLDTETYWWEAQTDPTNEEIEKEYFRLQEKTVDVGEKALKAKKYPAIEIQAYLASAWGSKARFRLTQHGVGLKTVLDGRKAHGYADDVYKADPNYTDILVGIGAYNYFTGKIPGILKPFAWLLGASGDAKLGLQQIRTVIDKGRYAQTEARIVLFTALMKDAAYDESFRVLRGMMADYPQNYALYDWAAQWYRDQNKTADGVEYFEKLHAEKRAASPHLAQHALYQKAVLQNEKGQPADARNTLARLRAVGTPDPGLARTIAVFEKELKK
jgi:hypothetical protein